MNKIMRTMDGNEAAAYAAYAFTEVAGIYPITPSSPMADYTDMWAAAGKKNLFGMPVKIVEMQSEAGAAGSVHGSLQTGALTTTYTASQGLLLKIPNMYKIAGQLLPCVIHVAARSLASQALSIFGDHQDIYAARQIGFALLCSHSVQETMDLAGVAHLAAIKGRIPFLHFFDGFRTSHEIQKVEVMDYAHFDRLIDRKAVLEFRNSSLSPENPKTRGTAQNDDIYFQTRELNNRFYQALPDIVNDYMQEISKITGRTYKPFVYYGAKDATKLVIAMGSVTQTIEEVVDYLNSKGDKVGLLKVYLYRPFSLKHFFEVIPESIEKIAVLDRTKEPGSIGEPLYLDVKSAFYRHKHQPIIVGGRYGLSSKDVDPAQIIAVYDNLNLYEPKDGFTVGIDDDVTHTSLKVGEKISLGDESTIECLFYGLGADGTVGANKNSIKIIGDKTDFYAQAYFAYDSKKSGGYTRSHLRFSKKPIRSTYLVSTPHFIACSVAAYLEIYDVLAGIRHGGTFLLNSIWSAQETIRQLPDNVKKVLAQKEVKFYIINATKLARDIGLGNRTNTIMQSAFFKLAEIIPYEDAQKYMKELAYKSYSKKGDAIIEMNYKAIDVGAEGLVKVEVDPAWKELIPVKKEKKISYKGTEFVEKIVKPMNAAKGDELPVSAFLGHEDGSFEHGTTEYEKRGVGVMVPRWIESNCIQCNQCASVCPHAVIRPFLIDDDEFDKAPMGVKEHTLEAKGVKDEKLKFKIQVSPLDCTGCELCVHECPTKEKSLVMVPLQEEIDFGEQENADYLFKKIVYKDYILNRQTTKGAQFSQPLFEFHGACPGCGETPYITLVTRLFGERMIVANATGCSSIYGGSAPSTPYRKSVRNGHGPAWANSLFEDNAEFGLGMKIATENTRHRIEMLMNENMDMVPNGLAALFKDWIANKNHAVSVEIKDKMIPLLEANQHIKGINDILNLKRFLSKKSHWIFGGDGWAYDIGYGGLDHVLASGEDVNILVLDTEVYSNTGGQSSKSSRTGAVAQFAAAGKPIQKKDLGQIAMTYGYIFVAQVNSSANYNHLIKALIAAEAYEGPSLVVCYSPCIAHGIKGGLGYSGDQGELATKCGYWPLYTYDPRLEHEGKNPLNLFSKEPDWSLYEQFLMNEVRYNSLKKANPEHAAELFLRNQKDAQHRYRQLKRIADADYSNELQA
ncbi:MULTISPECIES: pyruvate:ferredoxin (flavodoxin) oxidoreductase [unclassified Campylobacter]|uniref:pyruvate:ferredoxin (flavodoxin) oxidoreductase n=1 Tax=unclassified Campylobacter TaxID=2593542 RepID=UPI001237A877|nr:MULTISPECIES: pyruvate:ferredoxin (flavodoxin) oxidoreductase [unclassified Campylobacter]KAA6225076.1 pyruvate:ferredoxin (flavodoxin) oxidoreductase [Campylobacter sp. LR196d]KAA6226089.1 pyruvate:ferredoxin (flavodoxin) oxidoreductase [Campylobacter sp. LR185c]KAA6228036.1 pyruvate:ferredoxin (flavodoxin) oxidoreductase [Campylobacter sp. LR286c]KAA6231289.1 pyruvate:ferredoxin (flavodoxin) oxidoreductase [Campylobacter sp. LR264d]KAA6231501.1 pyruvate:ferredoxin (flavodoxin) oxidoreduct